MNNFQAFLHNQILLTTIAGWASAQIIKTLIDLSINKKLTMERLVGSGGMPSSHSSTVCSLATMCLLVYGAGSIEFTLSAVFAIVVMYDARGVRQETGKQAVILNEMMEYFENLKEGKIIFSQKELKELVGHTALQVFFGALLGMLVAIISFYGFQ